MKNLNLFPITFSILFLVNSIYLISNSAQEEIVGTWVAEGSSYENRWVYSEDHTVDRYYKNEIYKTYDWTIRELSAPSGKTAHELILTNIENADDQQKFIIETLTEERLILVYNTGVGLSRSTYIRQ